MRMSKLGAQFAVCAVTLLAAGAAVAGTAPTGLWIDHTGRGAVEITECGRGLCGHVAWVKDAENTEACGMQILGDVKPVSGGKWDGGWIYDPERDSKYDVELTPIGSEKLRVMGYAGMKFLSETMMWKRAPADLKKCNDAATTTAAAASPEKKSAAPSASESEKAAPAASTDTKVAAVPDETDSAVDTDAKDDADAKETENGTQPAKKGNKKTALLSKLGKFLDMPESGPGGKRECKVNVPFLEAVVTFPCPKK